MTNTNRCEIISATDYFTDAQGTYHWDESALREAHAQCLRRFIATCQIWNRDAVKHTSSVMLAVEVLRGIPGAGKTHYARLCKQRLLTVDTMPHIWRIYVDNTNLSAESIAPYIAVGQAYGFACAIQNFCCSVSTAMRRNIHGVPEEKLYAMESQMRNADLPLFWVRYRDMDTDQAAAGGDA